LQRQAVLLDKSDEICQGDEDFLRRIILAGIVLSDKAADKLTNT